MLLFGDILQLPPVKAPHVFDPVRSFEMNKYFGSVAPGINLWRSSFTYAELTENMRQREDLAYAELMNRMRTQQLTDEDKTLLKSRLIPITDVTRTMEETAQYYLIILRDDPTALAIFPKNEQVDKFNTAATEALGLQVVKFEAEDSWTREPKTDVFERAYQRSEFSLTGATLRKSSLKNAGSKISKTAGLEETVVLAINGRVMLRRNVDKKKGLINGATGVLQRIHYENGDENGKAISLEVNY